LSQFFCCWKSLIPSLLIKPPHNHLKVDSCHRVVSFVSEIPILLISSNSLNRLHTSCPAR
jgi:hypothetical protein